MTDQPAPVPSPDWEAFIRRHQAAGIVEIDLTTLRPGDTLVVVTTHTAYTLRMLENFEALLTTNRPDRPCGRVRINGCTFGTSSTIKLEHLFCGGNLEFVHGDGHQISTTTEIKALQLVQADAPPPA